MNIHFEKTQLSWGFIGGLIFIPSLSQQELVTLVPSCVNKLEHVEEQVDYVQVEVEGGEHVLLRAQRILDTEMC